MANLVMNLINYFLFNLNQTYSIQDFEKCINVYSQLRPGDIIFTCTPGKTYEAGRSLLDIEYDHVTVMLNEQYAIHISPVFISKINIKLFLFLQKKPFVIRPKFSQQEMERFLAVLHSFIGQKYSFRAAFELVKSGIKQRIFKSQQSKQQNQLQGKQENESALNLNQLKTLKICSNVILYCLCRANPGFHQGIIPHVKQIARENHFFPDELLRFMLLFKDTTFQIVYEDTIKKTNTLSTVSYFDKDKLFQQFNQIVMNPNFYKLAGWSLLTVAPIIKTLLTKKSLSMGEAIILIYSAINIASVLQGIRDEERSRRPRL